MKVHASHIETGTLIVFVPTRDGLVVGADSRGMAGGSFTDNREKLNQVDTLQPIVFVITGASNFLKPRPCGVELSVWVSEPGNYLFRMSDIVRGYLERRPDFALSEKTLNDAALELSIAISAFLRSHLGVLAQHATRDLCVLVLFQVDSDGCQIYGSAGLHVDHEGSVRIASVSFERAQIVDGMWFQMFGEWQYVMDNVINGPGREFLSQEAMSIRNPELKINDMSIESAVRFVSEVIRAAERMSNAVPIPGGAGIGGPVKALLITNTKVRLVQVPGECSL